MDKTKIETMRELVELQGQIGNYNVSDYMTGMFNGMELMLAIVEGREPDYKTTKHKLIDFDCLITNGVPERDQSIIGRIEKGWNIVAIVPAKLIHPHAVDGDMATIFTKYTPYPKEENDIPEASG